MFLGDIRQCQCLPTVTDPRGNLRYNRAQVEREDNVLQRTTFLRWLIPASFIILTLLAPDAALVCRLYRLVDPVVDPCDAPRDGAAGIAQHNAAPQHALPLAPELPAPALQGQPLPAAASPANLGIVADVATPPPRAGI
jgi:hypothetical protein